MTGSVYLIPTFLYENALETLPPYLKDAVQQCQVFFVENERSARRFLKQLWREMVIDDYEWFTIHKAEAEVQIKFADALKQGKNVAIISEAGCPGVADPGQILVESAQRVGATVKPFVGPSSILLALMASGMNGQRFQFVGYLPIDNADRRKALKDLEQESLTKDCSQIFIETPYRNNQLVKQILEVCKPQTRLCMAVDLTAPIESICTKTVGEWRRNVPDIHKKLAIFLLMA